VVRHEHVCVDVAAYAPAGPEKRSQVTPTVFVINEARAAVVAALDEMERLTGKCGARGAWHAGMDTRRQSARVIDSSRAGTIRV